MITSFRFNPTVLLNPILVVVSIIIVITCSVYLFVRKQKGLSRMILVSIVVICIVYNLFILWVVVGFGSNRPIIDPEPIQTSACGAGRHLESRSTVR